MNTLNSIQQQRIARSEALLMVHVLRMREAGFVAQLLKLIKGVK